MILGEMEIRLSAGIARLQADMDRARRTVDEATTRMGRAAGTAMKALGAIAGVLSVAAFASWIKGAIDASDAASKLSAKTGVAVQDIAGMQLAFDLGGAGGDLFAKSMVKLSLAIIDGNKGLASLGIKTKSVNGDLLSNKDALYAVANAFANMEDGAKKIELAIDIFGKTGADLIPLLNGGAEGFRQMEEMARKLGLTISEQTAKDAEAFNDNLDLLALGSQGVARGIAAELLPTLSDMSGALLESMTSGDKLSRTAAVLGAGLKGLFTIGAVVVEIFSTLGKIIGGQMATITTVIGGFTNVIAKIAKQDWSGAFDAATSAVRDTKNVIVAAGSDIVDGWESTGKALKKAWSGEGDAEVAAQAKLIRARKDALASQKEREAAAKKAAKESEAANKAANDSIAAMQDEIAQIGLAADQVKMMSAARAAAKAPEEAQRVRIMELALARDIATKSLADQAAADKVLADAQKGSDAQVAAINAETEALLSKIRTHGLLPEAITLARIAELEAQQQSSVLTAEGIADIQRRIDALKGLATAQAGASALGDAPGLTQAKELLDVMAELDEATKSAASGMAASFGRIEAAIGGLTTALSGYGRAQAAIAAQLQAVKDNKQNSPETVLKAELAASKLSAQARVKSYGDMASAAKGFFKENSSGYKTMEKVEKAYRAAEMAMAIESMLTKSGLLAAFTGFFVASKATETAADTASTGASIVNSLARAGASLTAGVAKAFEQMGVWGFVGAAAIIAFMGKMGVFGGTGGGGPAPGTFEERQKTQGTGTVLGDDTAKSESISRSLEIMEQNSSTELSYQNSMLQALRNIESALGGAAKGIFQTAGLTGGSAFGTSNTSTKSFFGSDKSTTITDSGVKFSGTLGQLRSGTGSGTQYEDVTKTSDGGWFSGNKRWDLTNTKKLDEKTMRPFTLIFDSMGDLLVGAGVKLGADSASLNSAINQIGIDFAVSTRELKGQDLIDALSAGVSVAFDKVATAVFPQVEQFQRVGEGMGETLVRVAANYASLDATLNSIGGTFGATGIASLEAREYLIDFVGGIEVLTEQTTGFANNFLSEAERLAPVQKQVTDQMAALGYANVTTREQFKTSVLDLVNSGALATKAGAETYAGLMRVQEAFALVTPAIEAVGGAAKTAAQILDEGRELQGRLDAARLTSEELLDRQRNALHTSNQALFDSVLAAEAKREADDALAQTNLGMQNDIDALVKASLSLSEQRALEVTGMAASTLALYQRREALQEEAKAVAASKAAAAALESTNAGFQKQIDDFLKASMTPAELRAVETKEMDKSTIALYDKLAGLKADKAAQDKLDQEERDRVAAEKQGAEEARRAAEKLRDAWQSITDTIFDEVARIRGLLDEGGVTSLSSAQSAFAIKTAQARAGDQDAAKLLPGLSKSLLDLAEANALTSLDLRRFQAQTLGSLTDTGNLLSQQFGLKIPGFAVGTNYVPSDMLAQIHEGERIIPKADNARLEQRLNQGSDAGALEAAIDRLTAKVADQQEALDKISWNTKKFADTQERLSDGGDASRVKVVPA